MDAIWNIAVVSSFDVTTQSVDLFFACPGSFDYTHERKHLRHPGLDPGSHSLGDYGSAPTKTNDLENHFVVSIIWLSYHFGKG
jgi:hypothetical protein